MKFVCVFLSRQLWNMHNSTTVNKNLHRVSTLTLNLFSFSTTRSWFSFMMSWIFYFVMFIYERLKSVKSSLWLGFFVLFLCFSLWCFFFFFFFWELWRTGNTFLLQEQEGATGPSQKFHSGFHSHHWLINVVNNLRLRTECCHWIYLPFLMVYHRGLF